MYEKNASYPSGDEIARRNEDADLAERVAMLEDESLADSPALNRLLLRNARKSFSDIAAATGIPVGEVAERLSTLLDNTSWRDDLMEEKLLLAEMSLLMDDVRERMNRTGTEDEAWASMARVALATIKTQLEQLNTRRKVLDGKLSALTLIQAQMFAEAIKLNNQLTIEALAVKYGIAEQEVYAEWEENFPKAVAYLEHNATR